MNTETLSKRSIVSDGEQIWEIEVLLEEEINRAYLVNGMKRKSMDVSDLQGVPITPEILEALGFERSAKVGFLDYWIDTNQVHISIFKDSSIGHKVEITHNTNENDIAYTRSREKLHLHDFQHFLKGVEGLDFEITLRKLYTNKL